MKINTYAVNCNDAWLNTEGDDISGSYVKYKDHQALVAELEAKCAALAVENAGLKNFIVSDCHVAHIEPETFYEEEVTRYVSADGYEPETPATDAYLAEVRAQGVEMFMESDECSQEAYGLALHFAAQLRQDANTAELVAAGIITRIED